MRSPSTSILMCWACLKRGLIRVFVFEAGDLSPAKNLKREKRTKKKPLRRRACARGALKIERTPLCVLKIEDTCAVRGLIRLDRTAKIYTVRGRKKHKVPRMCIVYHFSETDQFLCDIMGGFAVTCVISQQKKPSKMGAFLRVDF